MNITDLKVSSQQQTSMNFGMQGDETNEKQINRVNNVISGEQ